MIDEALKFLCGEVNLHVKSVLGDAAATTSAIELSPIFGQNGDNLVTSKLGMTLVNIEEERVNMAQRREAVRQGDSLQYMAPEVRLNLHVLVVANATANNEKYEGALKALSAVITFFQSHRYFTAQTHPTLPSALEKLVVELETLDYEFQNHIWGTLGGKLMPSVLYRVRLVTIQQGLVQDTGAPIVERDIMGVR